MSSYGGPAEKMMRQVELSVEAGSGATRYVGACKQQQQQRQQRGTGATRRGGQNM
jgi:hypothetical protein